MTNNPWKRCKITWNILILLVSQIEARGGPSSSIASYLLSSCPPLYNVHCRIYMSTCFDSNRNRQFLESSVWFESESGFCGSTVTDTVRPPNRSVEPAVSFWNRRFLYFFKKIIQTFGWNRSSRFGTAGS